MFDDEDAFQEFRAYALRLTKERNEAVLKEWFSKINFKGTVGYYNSDGIFTIYTDRPGLLIGKAGRNIDIFKEILRKEFRRDYEVKFIEIRGGFVTRE